MTPSERVRFSVRSRWRVVLGWIATLGPFSLAAYALVAIMNHHGGTGLGLMVMAVGIVLSLVIGTRANRGLSSPGPFAKADVTVREDGITIATASDAIELGPKEVTRAYVQPRGSAAEVVIETKAGRCELSAYNLNFAREILDALGQGPGDRPITFAFAGGLRVTVGVDGVVVAWPILRRKRFVPHARIVRVENFAGDVVLELDDGSKYEIAMGSEKTEVELREALVERLNEARALHDASVGGGAAVLIAREGRSIDTWVREAKTMTSGGGGQYRSATPPPDVLWRIVTDPSEDEEKRVGASLALRGALDDEGRERLRLAAEAAASPRVRVALLASAEEEDDDAVIAKLEARHRD